MKTLFFILLVAFLGISIATVEAETFKMYVQKMPTPWQKDFGDVLAKATTYWENKTAGLKFESVNYVDPANFVVEWASQYDSGKLGYYSTSTSNQYGKPKLTITLGYFKDKKWNLVSSDYALEITKHELGHAIGLPHSTDPNDIMYPQIESYESWQQAKTKQTSKLTTKTSATTDWKAKSIKYQTLSDQKIFSSKSEILNAETSLNNSTASNKASKAELDKAWNSFWSAKKYLNDAELIQQEADSLFYDSNYKDSFYKYKSSYESTKKVGGNLLQIKVYLKKSSQLQ